MYRYNIPMAETYSLIGFWMVVFGFLYVQFAYPDFFVKRPAYIGFHTLSLGVFIIYMYESGEYTNDEVHKIAAKIGIRVTNRQVGIILLVLVLLYTVFKTYSVSRHK